MIHFWRGEAADDPFYPATGLSLRAWAHKCHHWVKKCQRSELKKKFLLLESPARWAGVHPSLLAPGQAIISSDTTGTETPPNSPPDHPLKPHLCQSLGKVGRGGGDGRDEKLARSLEVRLTVWSLATDLHVWRTEQGAVAQEHAIEPVATPFGPCSTPNIYIKKV